MGRAAARLLLEQLSGEELEDATQVPGQLIIRESCGASLRKGRAHREEVMQVVFSTEEKNSKGGGEVR